MRKILFIILIITGCTTHSIKKEPLLENFRKLQNSQQITLKGIYNLSSPEKQIEGFLKIEYEKNNKIQMDFRLKSIAAIFIGSPIKINIFTDTLFYDISPLLKKQIDEKNLISPEFYMNNNTVFFNLISFAFQFDSIDENHWNIDKKNEEFIVLKSTNSEIIRIDFNEKKFPIKTVFSKNDTKIQLEYSDYNVFNETTVYPKKINIQLNDDTIIHYEVTDIETGSDVSYIK